MRRLAVRCIGISFGVFAHSMAFLHGEYLWKNVPIIIFQFKWVKFFQLIFDFLSRDSG
jgi:hypothetical protein